MKHETTEAMLSRMADEREQRTIAQLGLTSRAELRAYQQRCVHVWVAKTYYDACSKCGAGRA